MYSSFLQGNLKVECVNVIVFLFEFRIFWLNNLNSNLFAKITRYTIKLTKNHNYTKIKSSDTKKSSKFCFLNSLKKKDLRTGSLELS